MERQSRPVARGAAHLSGGFGEPAAASAVAHRTLGIAFRIKGAHAPSIQRRVRTSLDGMEFYVGGIPAVPRGVRCGDILYEAPARASLREQAAKDRDQSRSVPPLPSRSPPP
jgi:hypothetical protein